VFAVVDAEPTVGKAINFRRIAKLPPKSLLDPLYRNRRKPLTVPDQERASPVFLNR